MCTRDVMHILLLHLLTSLHFNYYYQGMLRYFFSDNYHHLTIHRQLLPTQNDDSHFQTSISAHCSADQK